MRPGLILFDIDGTLLLSGRAGLRAMNRALREACGITDGLDGIGFGGRTDSFLVSHALQAAGVPDSAAHHDRVRELYVPLLAEEIQQRGTGHYGLMPGAKELLEALSDYPDLYVALLTGNFREAATVKLAQFEIADHFEWGAFSDDAADRNELVPIARERAETYDVPIAARERIIVIGDTPHDIDCAKCAGARCIAVATGGFSIDQLREAGADEVIADLTDTEAVIALLS